MPAAVPAMPPMVIDPHAAGAFGAAIVSGLLILQWAHRRKPFILAWAAGWLIIAPELLLLSQPIANPILARTVVGISQLFSICSALLFLWSADLYRQTRYLQWRPMRWLLAVAA